MPQRVTYGYARLSVQTESNRDGITYHSAGIKTYAEQHGWTVARTVTEVERATRGTRRPVFENLVSILETAPSEHRLICTDLDRLTRNFEDLETLLDLAERGLEVHSITGNLRLDTSDGRFMARLLTSVKAKEVEELERRVRFNKAQAKAAGKFLGHGRRSFGFTDGTADRMHHPDEAPILREVFDRITNGETWTRIAEDLNGRGIRNTEGGSWTRLNLSKTFENPGLYGKMRTIEGGREVYREAPWQPIFTQEDEQRIRQVRDQNTKHRGSRELKYPLSNFLICAHDGHTMQRQSSRGYACRGAGCGKRIAPTPTDELLEKLVLLNIRDALTTTTPTLPDLSHIEQRTEQVATLHEQGIIGRAAYRAELRDLEAERQRLIREAEAVAATIPDWMRDEDSLLAAWTQLHAWDKRDLYRRTLGTVFILPSQTQGFEHYDEDRILTRFDVRRKRLYASLIRKYRLPAF